MKIQTLLKFLNISRKNNNSSGFTLIELLLAAAISSLIIGVAGWGLVTLMGSKKASDSQSDKQGEINRASDFINDEIRKARYINEKSTMDAIASSGPTYKYTLPVSPGASLSNLNNKNVVLVLQIPDTADNGTDDETVIYYVESVPNNTTTWRGPMVIRRWGPTFNANGGYNIVAGNLSYTDDTLIDGIKETDLGSSFNRTNCPDVTPSSGFSGLYACLGGKKLIDGDINKPYYTTAQLNINGVFKKATDSGTTAYSGASDGSTQTVSRINAIPGNILSTLAVPSKPPSIGLAARFLCRQNPTPVPWRVRTTINIDGFTFSYLEGQPIDNLTNLINGSRNPDFAPTGKTLSDYKISKSPNGNSLQVEKKNSGSGGYSVVPNGFTVAVEPYVVTDGNGNYLVANTDGTQTSVPGAPIGIPAGNPTPTTNNTADNINQFQAGCDNSKPNMLVNNVNNPNQTVVLSRETIQSTNTSLVEPGKKVILPSALDPYTQNVAKGFNGDKPTLQVLEESGYLKSTTTTTQVSGTTETTTTYETNISNDEMVFLFEIGHQDKTLNGNTNEGFDLQDKSVILTW